MNTASLPVWPRFAAILFICGLGVLAWIWLSRSGIGLEQLHARLSAHRHAWYALPAVVCAFIVAGLAMVPVTLLIAATGIAFGPLLGPVYAMAGCLASASTGFASTVHYRDFIIGTVLGMSAFVIGLAGFGYQITSLLRDPSLDKLIRAALFVLVPLTLAVLINHTLRRLRPVE